MILYALRKNAGQYIHGHSAGGTNPSLVEAMFFGCPILAYGCVYNRESTSNQALYWTDSDELVTLLNNGRMNGTVMRQIAEEQYTWKQITRQYEELY